MSACPHCGAEQRLGVWMTPRKLAIFDRVKRSGDDGAHYGDFDMSRGTLRVHIYQINALLEETDYAIRGYRGNISGYRLVKVR